MKKIFTFLVAFLTTVSGAVWGQYKATLDLSNPQDGDGVEWRKDWLGRELRVFQIQEEGTYLVKGLPNGVESDIRVDIDLGAEMLERSRNVTIVLDNVNIHTSGNSPIWVYNPDPTNLGGEDREVNLQIQLIGENNLSCGDGAAISLNGNSNLTIIDVDQALDGILNVSGTVGIGNPEGIPGDIQINGGTVVAQGSPAIGGNDDNGTRFALNGNAFVVVDGVENVTPVLTKGIYCNKANSNTIATVYGDVLLNSTYPDDEDYKLTIDPAATLTLGEGYSLPKDRMANIEADEARFRAYELNFMPNYQPGDVPTGSNTSTLSNYYRGKNTTVSNLPALTCSSCTHNFLGWMNMETNDVSDNTCTTLNTDPSELKRINIRGVWTQKVKTINANVEKGTVEDGVILLSPSNPNITLEPQAGESWPGEVVLNDWTLSGKIGADDVTLPGQSKDVVCDVKINGETKTTLTVKFYISSKATTIEKASVKSDLDNTIFANASLVSTVLDIKTTDGSTVEFKRHYTIKSCTFTPAGSSSPESVTDIFDAGTYSDIVIEPVPGMAVMPGGEVKVTGTVTVKPYPVSVVPTKGQLKEEGEVTPTITFALEPATPFGQELVTKGALALESTPSVGNVKITKGDLALDDSNGSFKASNYELSLQEETFLIRDKIEDTDVTVQVENGASWEYDGRVYSEGFITSIFPSPGISISTEPSAIKIFPSSSTG